MAYTESATFPPEQGDPVGNFLVRGGAEILLGDIFNGLPQLYAGSNFTIEEIFECETLMLEPQLIDADFRWSPPKRYFGTWTASDTLPGFGVSSEDRGFIDSEVFKIKRYSTFVIQANANVVIAEHEEGVIDNCNFILNQIGIEIPPLIGSQQILEKDIAVFRLRTTLRNVPLQERPFYPKLRFVGTYINVGATIIRSKYTARVINGVSVDLPLFPPTACSVPLIGDCQQAYDNFRQTSPGTYSDEISCTNGEGTNCAPFDFVCPSDPTQVFTYWQGINQN